MKHPILALLAAGCMAIAGLTVTQSAHASDAICANPQGAMEKAFCEDPHLMGLNLQMNIMLNKFRSPANGELPDGLQREYAHHMIEFEECNGKYRCLASGLQRYTKQLEDRYMRGKGRWLAKHQRVRFSLHQSQDSPGRDMIPSKNPRNFGWTQRLCQLRCASQKRCIGVGYDPLQQNKNAFGYCTMKTAVTFPLKKWRPTGVFLFKQP